MTDHIVRDVLTEYGVDPADFRYGEGEDFECPSCPRETKSAQGLTMHHKKLHGYSVRAAVCGGTDQYREILERLHCEHELAPTAISKALPDTVGERSIRTDCKDLGIYKPHPTSPSDGIAAKLDEMDPDEFDTALAGDGA